MKSPLDECIDPSHHVRNGSDFVQAVARVCGERGLRLTPIRAQVIEMIAVADKPLKAYDLLNVVRSRNGAGADAPPTIYRALDFLLANGFIHKLQSINAFVACHHPGSLKHSVPFLICDLCHSAVELEDGQVVASLNERARVQGFVPHAQTLEVHGLCARCAEGIGKRTRSGEPGIKQLIR